jgi:hypothetical protein
MGRICYNARMRFRKPSLAGLGLALALGLGFLVLSFSRLAGDTISAAFHNVVHESALAGPFWGTALSRNLLVFVSILLTLHLCFGAACWAMARLSAFAFSTVRATPRQWVLLWCSLGFVTILIANAALYPNSSLGRPYADQVRAGFGGIDVFVMTTAAATIAILATIGVATWRWLRSFPRPPRRPAAAAAGLAALAIVTTAALPSSGRPAAATDKPHVIILGIDSLRYDETRPGGPTDAVNVRRFLEESISFSDATTPLARTFPSWLSILTGRNPHTTGGIINLLPRERIRTGETLGDLFRRAGYRTVYGIDEVRFSNIDTSYGFDEAITPPIGASDFLIGWFGDTPLSNLLVNTRLGAALFPHLHANRGAAKLYDPGTYLQQVERRLDFEQPTFLALHLTLAHWPFIWRDAPDARGVVKRRKLAVERVDRQFAAALAMLERRGALKNALVVVLSDHGESLGLMEDTLVRDTQGIGELYEEHKLPQGHGTDVLSPQQYQVVLGVRCFGKCPVSSREARVIDAPVSLEDVAPTLNELFGLGSRDRFDGRSLRGLLAADPGAAEAFRGRVRFTESEFNPVGIMQSGGDVSASAAAAAALFYTIDPVTDRVEVRETKLNEILEERQYAAFDENMLLAALPHPVTKYRLVAVRRDRSEARQLTGIPDPTRYPELVPLYEELAWRYGFARGSAPAGDAN